MQRQGSFSQAEYAGKKKRTRRDKFLAEKMELVVPWARLVARLRPLYPNGERGRPPIGLERMLRIYFLQQWYGLADEALEDALYDSQALRGFVGIELTRDPVPDATTLLKFRHWLERHDLTKALFEDIAAMLEERGLLMRQGTIVDATIIAAPPSGDPTARRPCGVRPGSVDRGDKPMGSSCPARPGDPPCGSVLSPAAEFPQALYIADGLAARNPDNVPLQILVLQILAEMPGAHDHALQHSQIIRARYKLTAEHQAMLAALDQAIPQRAPSAQDIAANE
jgi:IS5 family transposase